ncbi:hypothetical protein ACFLVH_00980 [Chloroflexota bacterium]
MRQQQVRALIEHVRKDLEKIKTEYETSLQSKTINLSLQIDVKNLMENLRSTLDYIANDVYQRVVKPDRVASGQKEIKDIYFPYGKDEKDFKSSVGRYLPKLEALSPHVFSIFERIQPHKCGNNWLFNFCNILNRNKHDNLSPQTRVEKRGLKLDFAGGGGITLGPGAIMEGSGKIVSGSGVLELRGNTVSGDSPVEDLPQTIKQTVIIWVGFRFADTEVDVLPLVQLASKEIEQLAKDIYSTI